MGCPESRSKPYKEPLDRAIRKENGGRFESKVALVEAAQRAWNNIMSEYIDKLIFSMLICFFTFDRI
jgi:hypothetical protein